MLARAVSVQQAYGASYWHLLTEVAPRLLLALPLLRADPGCHVLMPATAASRQLLRMLHLDPRRIAEVPNPSPNPTPTPTPNPHPTPTPNPTPNQVPKPLRIHWTGCPNSCGQVQCADI